MLARSSCTAGSFRDFFTKDCLYMSNNKLILIVDGDEMSLTMIDSVLSSIGLSCRNGDRHKAALNSLNR